MASFRVNWVMIMGGLALTSACGGDQVAASAATSVSTTSETDETDEGGGPDCAGLAEPACESEPACTYVSAGELEGSGDAACISELIGVGCVEADACGGEPCLMCVGSSEPTWFEDCSCAPAGWTQCGGPAPEAPQMCECATDSDCHPAQLCEDGQCRLCDQADPGCDCEFTGCPQGFCCGHGSVCTPGETQPNSHFCDEGDPSGCDGSECGMIDVVVVVDNSSSMGEEQAGLAAALDQLVAGLQALEDDEGQPLNPDVNILVTSTDMGHALCDGARPPGYAPLEGAPQEVACVDRLADFDAGGDSWAQACTDACPQVVLPVDPYVHFEGSELSLVTNVPGNNVSAALRCIGLQGVAGCDYSSPLEAMLQAINPGAAWNTGADPFMRSEAMLALVVLTDAYDCSVRRPDGDAYFLDAMFDEYWQLNPDTGTKTEATPAVCWNAGVSCEGPDMDGVYAGCNAIDTGGLHPTNRYLNYLRNELIGAQNKEVVMLGVVGVPPVTARNDLPPYQPTAGGVFELVYRDWVDGAYPIGDILPGDPDAAQQTFELGIGPGCTAEDGMGGFLGQATPPARLREVCEGLDEDDQLRCCLESVCTADMSAAFGCLSGMVQTIVTPPG